MTSEEYINKYDLDFSNDFNESEFITDLINDFLLALDEEPPQNVKQFKEYVNSIHDLYREIRSNSLFAKISSDVWNKFYLIHIIEIRKRLFPDYKEFDFNNFQSRKSSNRKKKRKSSKRKASSSNKSSYSYISNYPCFEKLGLNNNSTEEQVKKAYRKLSLENHPDRGGNNRKFIEITEAKNKCLKILKNSL